MTETVTALPDATAIPAELLAQLRQARAEFDARLAETGAGALTGAPLVMLNDEAHDVLAPEASAAARVLVAQILAMGRRANTRRVAAAAGTGPFTADVTAERHRQLARWGDQRHPDGTGRDPRRERAEADQARRRCQRGDENGRVTWRDILAEQVAEAYAEADPAGLRTELVQCAAVIAAWIYDIDRRRILPPVMRTGAFGLPVYRTGRAPQHLATRRQLRAKRLSPAGLPVAAWLHTAPYHSISPLYDSTKARAIRPLTYKQREVLAAGREGRFAPCVLCGTRTIRQRGAESAYCPDCW